MSETTWEQFRFLQYALLLSRRPGGVTDAEFRHLTTEAERLGLPFTATPATTCPQGEPTEAKVR